MMQTGKPFLLTEAKLLSSSIPFNMLWVEPGEFVLGANMFNDKNSYQVLPVGCIKVLLTKGFWLSQYPVTQKHWETFTDYSLDAKIYWDKKENRINKRFPEKELPRWQNIPNLPMYWSNWLETMQFCRLLNIKYREQLPEGYHFSLPTEVQWEYVCKAGLNADYTQVEIKQWHKMDFWNTIDEVGRCGQNPWGFYDMLGNIREYCFDSADNYPEPNTIRNYKIDSLMGDTLIDWVTDWNNRLMDDNEYRVVRGQYTSVYREYCELKQILDPSGHHPPIGFRVALRPITKYDINDPWLKHFGINILGDDKV